MKKLVILIVLGLASVSLAGEVPLPSTDYLYYTLAGDTMVIHGNVAPATGNWWHLGIDYETSITYGTATVLAAAGSLGDVTVYTTDHGFDITIGGTDTSAGEWFEIQAPGLTVGTWLSVWDYALDPSGNTLAAGETINTPEPMTLALLALGAIMMRRKS